MHTLEHLYTQQLRDIYDAEKQLVAALPKMANAATSDKLKQAFNHHLDQTRNQVQRLETIFNAMSTSAQGEPCEAMQGLIKEGEDIIKEDGDPKVKDAALIAIAQRVEHYEIAAYGTVCTYADELGHDDSLRLLKDTLREEKKTDSKLTDLAVNTINPNPDRVRPRAHGNQIHWETVIGLYDNFQDARAAIEELVDNGVDRTRVSLVANENDERYVNYIRHLQDDDVNGDDPDAEEGAGFGAVVGTLTGLGVALIPGIGQFVVAGAAGAALFSGIGAALGAGTGGLTAGLLDLGVDEDQAAVYSERLRTGGTMVIVHVDDDWEDKAESILRNHNPISVEDIDQS